MRLANTLKFDLGEISNAMKHAVINLGIAAALIAVCLDAIGADQANADMVRSYMGAEEAARAGVARNAEGAEPPRQTFGRGPEDIGADTERRPGVLAPKSGPSRLSNLVDKRRVKAVRGDVAAQYNLGLMYARGEGVERDYKEAAKWLRNPAEQGYELAQVTLGEIYSGGKGVEQDYKEAASWYRKAAEQGNALAQHRIGEMYAEEKGVRYNPREAEKWLRKAAEGGDAQLQFELGERYANGKGILQSAKEAERWFRAAASQGDAGMQFYLGQLYREYGEVVVQDREEAIKWFGRAAEQGHETARFNLGVMHLNGEGVQIDMVQAHKWLSLATASGNEREEAQRSLKIAEARMSAEQIKEAQRLAAEWLASHQDVLKSAAPAQAEPRHGQRAGSRIKWD